MALYVVLMLFPFNNSTFPFGAYLITYVYATHNPCLMIRQFAFRISVMKICGGALIDWDYSKMCVCKSHNFFYWTWLLHTTGGFIYSGIMAIHLLQKMYPDEWDDPDNNPTSAATTIIGWGEAAATTCICLLSTVLTIHREAVIDLINEILEHNKFHIEMLTSGNRKLSKRHKMEYHFQETLMVILILFSLVLPAMLGMIFAHPIEPTRRMLQTYFEIEVQLTLRWFPVLIIFGILLIAAGNGAIILCMLVSAYFSVSTIGLMDTQPEEIHRGGPNQTRYKFETRSLGVLEDERVIVLYRKLQLYNIQLNDILANLMVSFHNVASIVAVVSMAYFGIAYHDVIADVGIIGYIVVFGSMIVPLTLQFTEATMFGTLCDTSDDFADSGRKLVWRKSLYGKFLRTCRTFYVEEAYPFYHIHKETFLLFCEQCLGYIADLLLA